MLKLDIALSSPYNIRKYFVHVKNAILNIYLNIYSICYEHYGNLSIFFISFRNIELM